MAPLLAGLVAALPAIVDTVNGLADNFDVIPDDDRQRILGYASQAVALVPEAIDGFIKLKDTLGGRKPTVAELRDYRMEIAAQSQTIRELRDKAHQDAGDGG